MFLVMLSLPLSLCHLSVATIFRSIAVWFYPGVISASLEEHSPLAKLTCGFLRAGRAWKLAVNFAGAKSLFQVLRFSHITILNTANRLPLHFPSFTAKSHFRYSFLSFTCAPKSFSTLSCECEAMEGI